MARRRRHFKRRYFLRKKKDGYIGGDYVDVEDEPDVYVNIGPGGDAEDTRAVLPDISSYE